MKKYIDEAYKINTKFHLNNKMCVIKDIIIY